jgi:DNA excision repair protein ERCC-2
VISVRALCDLTAKTGDLDQRFTPSPTALEGMMGHLAVTSRRDVHYLTEITLTGEFEDIFVRGRADGYDPDLNQLEEIKTYKGSLERMPDNHRQLHWAQAKVYAHLLCQERELAEINVALVYYNVSAKAETILCEPYSAEALKDYFDGLCVKLRAWAQQEIAHRQTRDKALLALNFPHPKFRRGQRVLAESVYKTAKLNRCLMIQATTGIGKTLGTIFPLLKAMPEKKLDKVFFLTAKTSGRQLGLDAIKVMSKANPDLKLRLVELVAKEKSCEHPDKSCHGDSCPLAQGFYDRLPAARQEALQNGMMDKNGLRLIAQKHAICPYYLGQDLSSWADMVVGDYNYYFDLYALLFAGTVINEWKVSVLVDEAHNMIERARKMYSAELNFVALMEMKTRAPKTLRSALDKLAAIWDRLQREQYEAYEVYNYINEEFELQLQRVVTRITDYLAEHPTDNDASLLNFYFDALQFTALAESFGPHSLFDITKLENTKMENTKLEYTAGLFQQNSVLCIRNVIPAIFLKKRFAAADSATLFSATLSPPSFYSDMLGLPEKTPFLDVESPFDATQLQVKVAAHISTRYKHRPRSFSPIVELMAQQYQAQAGNYILFLSSFEYLREVSALLQKRYPGIPTREQSRIMNEAEREAFVNAFTPTSRGIAFAVLGGSFGEAIDLPGDRLIGAFIATLGLPQINPINEQMRLRMEDIFGLGYEYTYLYPGLQKVVQAAGRVIRTTDDKGIIYLIDDRYTQSEVTALLPKWWHVN